MTDNEINIAVAEVCGWERDPKSTILHGWIEPKNQKFRECVPDYCHDLNTIHEAEQVGIKSDDQADSYFRWLHVLVGSKMPFEAMPLLEQCGVIRATARQRSEAFLKTLNKWKE